METKQELDKERYFDEQDNFGERLKNLLRGHKISNQTLSTLLECSDQTISDYLNYHNNYKRTTKKPFWIPMVRLFNFLQDKIEDFNITWLLNNKETQSSNNLSQIEKYQQEIKRLRQEVQELQKSRDEWKEKYEKVNQPIKDLKAFSKKFETINLYALYEILKYFQSQKILPVFYSLMLSGNLAEWLKNVRNYVYCRVQMPKLKNSNASREYNEENKQDYERLTKLMLEEYLENNPKEYENIVEDLRKDFNNMKWDDDLRIYLTYYSARYSRVEEKQTINPMYGIGETIPPEHYNENQKISKLD